MIFRNTNTGILLRRWIAKYLFVPVYAWQYITIYIKLFLSKQQPLVIVLTIGKVGSSSVYYSLKEQFSSRIFHIHYISEEGIQEAWKAHKSSSRNSVPLHLITSKILSNFLKKYQHKYHIITIFREPIQRKLSSFFQNLDQHKDAIDLGGLDFNTVKLNDVLNDSYFLNRIHEEDTWIENELIKTFNFNVYNKADFQQSGFSIERNKIADLLSIKMENLNKEFTIAMTEFFETERKLVLKTVNDGDDKYYNQAYKSFKQNFKLNESTLHDICGTKYFLSFYADLKLRVINKWKR